MNNEMEETLNCLFEKSSLLPSNLTDYPNQIGGHGLLFGNKCKILYSHEESTIYKPIQHYPKGPHELDFYQRLFDPNCCEPALIELRQFVPDFYGLYRDSQGKHLYLGLKDVLANFKHPSLCDLKMGRRTYAPDSSPSKIMIECAKYKWREEIGFLVTGLRVFNPSIKEHTTFDIFFGRSLDPTTIYSNGIRLFLGNDVKRAQRLAQQYVLKLSQLAKWFESQTRYHFYASSLLLAYDDVAAAAAAVATAADAIDDNVREFNSSSPPNHYCNGLNNSHPIHEDDHLHPPPPLNQSTVSQSFPSPLSPLPSAPATSFMTNETQAEESVLVYLIDFTRWEMIENTNDMKKDENFLYGLYYLIDLFKRAANDNSSSLPADAIPTKNTVQS
uniref:Kinase n=1 Tax=Trichobilharzia regenti TaxID=157069 RepID=A0AA85ITV3_TRIRE|nr:unnamed protein product [Trichobilharzia regenti]